MKWEGFLATAMMLFVALAVLAFLHGRKETAQKQLKAGAPVEMVK